MKAEQLRCVDKVADACAGRLNDIRAMLDPEAGDLDIAYVGQWYEVTCNEATVTTLTNEHLLKALVESYEPERWAPLDLLAGVSLGDDGNSDIIDALLERLFDEYEDDIREASREAWYDYGLSFDYVEPGTFGDQDEGYWRYQISWGGPSEEIRFYASKGHSGWRLHRAEFWYFDWLDGAKLLVTSDETVRAIWDNFEERGSVEHVFSAALER